MSDISEMSARDKSVLLARAMGWELELATCGEPRYAVVDQGGGRLAGSLYYTVVDGMGPIEAYANLCPKLYDEANMALAWRVLNWAMDRGGPWGLALDVGDFELEGWLYECQLWNLSGSNAQRAWLDKCLALAIEAGLVEHET